MLKDNPDKLVARHAALVHSEQRKVASHVQREAGDWIVNTVMLEGEEVPFKYKRKRKYKSVVGARVNLTYYPRVEKVANFDIEVMKVVRIRRS